MSESEFKSIDKTSYEELNGTTSATTTETDSQYQNSNKDEENSKNSTSDDDEEDKHSLDELIINTTGLEGTCSRSRPYVRGRKNFSNSNNGNSFVKSSDQTDKVVCCAPPMPTPPTDPDEPDDVTTNIIPLKYAAPSESLTTKCEKVVAPESSQTELHGEDGYKKNYMKAERVDHEKSDSESVDDETSPKKPNTTPTTTTFTENPAKTLLPKLEIHKHHHTKAIELPDQNSKSFTSSDSSCLTNVNSSGYPGSSRKGSKIPVGIAVAWQRLVTSSSTVENSTSSSITSCAPSMSTKDNKSTISGNNKLSELPCPGSPIKIPLRPSSASSLNPIHNKSSTTKYDKVGKRSGGVTNVGGSGQNIRHISSLERSSTPDLGVKNVTSRPLPSSSVPPNLSGLSYLHHTGSLMDYHLGLRSASPIPSLNSHHHGHFPPTWPQVSGSDLSVPQGFTSPGVAAAYLQQTVQNQIQLHQHYQAYSSYPSSGGGGGYLHPGYETLRQQYEQFLLNQHHQQQQHSELLRQYHHHQQQQQHQQLLLSSSVGSGYDGTHERVTPTIHPECGSPRISIPILSPTGRVRTPTPTTLLNPSHHSLSLSNLSTAGISAQNWPAELYHHNSSTTLSPKSLTSSTPSPVTVQHEFSPLNLANTSKTTIHGSSSGGSFIGRKCSPTPNPISSKSFPVNSPVSGASSKNVHKDVTKSRVEQKKHLSMSIDKKGIDDLKSSRIENSEKEKSTTRPQDLTEEKVTPNGVSEQLSPGIIIISDDDEIKRRKQENLFLSSSISPTSPTYSSSSSSQPRNDFSRMESLIEKRVQQSSPAFQNETTTKQEHDNKKDLDLSLKTDDNVIKMGQECLISLPVKVETDFNSNQTMDLKQQDILIIAPEKKTVISDTKDDTKKKKVRSVSSSQNNLAATTKERSKKSGCINNPVAPKLGKVKKNGELKKQQQNSSTGESFSKSQSSKERKTPLKEVKAPKKPRKPISSSVVDDDMASKESKPRSRKKKIQTDTKNQSEESPQQEQPKPNCKPKQSKTTKKNTKKTERRASCDPYFVNSKDVTKQCEDYKKRNVVPDFNLPVSSSTSKIYANNFNQESNNKEKALTFNGGASSALPFVVNNNSESCGNASSNSNNKRSLQEEDVYSSCRKSIKVKDEDSSTSIRISRDSISDINSNNIIGSSSGGENLCNSEINCNDPTVLIATPSSSNNNLNQSISLCGVGGSGNTISLNSVTLPATSYNSVVSVVSSNNAMLNPNPVITVPYQNSPVTLILPRILPQSTITNSHHHQTSFKLVVSSQEIKIPTFVSSYSNSEETTTQTFQLHHQKSYSTLEQNVNVVTTSTLAASSSSSSSAAAAKTISVLSPCDNKISGSNKNTITFIGDVNPNGSSEIHPSSSSSSAYQIRQTTFLPHNTQQTIIKTSKEPGYMEPNTTIYHSQQQQEPHNMTQNNNNNNNIFMRKDFIEPEDNHLNLLATVAQEFGSRDDLGKLVSCNSSLISSIGSSFKSNNSSRGSSTMTSPIHSMQSPEINFSKSANVVSISLPTSPVAKSYSVQSKPQHDEYEYDEKEQGGNEISPGSYKHPVWLKIPHIIPQAANKVAEKLRKAQRKQEKALKVTTKRPKSLKKKREHSSKPKISDSSVNDNTQLDTISLLVDESLSLNKKSIKTTKKKITKHQISDSSQLSGQNSKLKIPKITLSTTTKTKSEKPAKTTNRSPVKAKIKEEPSSSSVFLKHSNNENVNDIKLHSLNDITCLSESNSINADKSIEFEIKQESKVKKEGIKRRHSDGDKLSKKRNNKNKYDPNSSSSLLDLKSIKNNKPKKSSLSMRNVSHSESKEREEDVVGSFPQKTPKTIKRNKIESLVTPATNFTTQDLLLSSFTSLTPPPTAKPLFDQPNTQEHDNIMVSHSTVFSPSTNTENDLNWVADPTFAVSAIRQSNNLSSPFNLKEVGSSGESQTENATSGETKKSRRNSKTDQKGKSPKSSKSLSLLNLHNQTNYITDNHDKNAGNVVKDLKSQLKSFVHFQSKRVKPKSHHHRHHIKPRLKAEPIIRPLSSITSSSDSDTEIDLEVATLTNSIPRYSSTSMKQNSPNTRKSQHQQGIISQFKANSIKNATHNKRRLSSTHSSIIMKKEKSFISRRLSLNLETGKTRVEEKESDDDDDNDEELLDIDEDYSSTSLNNNSQNSTTTTTSQSRENENKQSSNNNKHAVKESSSGSGSSAFWPKRMPKKRSSRSSTATSNSGRVGTHSSASNKSSTTGHHHKDSLDGLLATGGGESSSTDVNKIDETLLPGKIELESVGELLDEMRILTEIQGLFYTGKLNELQPPDVYGVSLDNERGAPPHLIFSAEEVLEKCIRERKPKTLIVGLRICAYWSPQYSGLYPGRVSTDFNPHFDPEKDLIPIEFDDGDTGMIKLGEIRLLPANHPIREYDPNPLLTLEKKHRKRRHSSTNTNSGPCTGDHEEADCGESYCAKVAKLEEEDDDDELRDTNHSFKSLYWTWTGLGYKRPKSKKTRNKEFFRGIQRGDEIINVGDSAIFISHGNERPYIGRVEKFWEKKGQKVVNVRWFYHPEEVKSPKRIPHLKYPGALFESPHIDDNDVQTIARKCDVLPFPEFKERIGRMPKLSLKNSKSSKPRDLYYCAGYYDPYNYNLQLKI